MLDDVNTTGPLASRDLVFPIDLQDLKGETVRFKLECGFMFWEVDYIAMDFSENSGTEIREVTAAIATDETGKDVTALIAASDNQYLVQPTVGNVVTAEYHAPYPKSGNSHTVFLHSRGYYEYIRDYKNMPRRDKIIVIQA